MVRSAAKNFEDVAVVTSPADYPALIEELRANQGKLSRETRWRLAQKAFACHRGLRRRDRERARERRRCPRQTPASVANASRAFPGHAAACLSASDAAALWRKSAPGARRSMRRQRHRHRRRAAVAGQGAELQQPGRSRRLLGAGAASSTSRQWPSSSTPIPAALPRAATVLEAYQKALEADPVSAFGGVIGINREVDEEAAEEIAKLFVEAIAAPGFQRRSAGDALRRRRICGWCEVSPAEPRRGC